MTKQQNVACLENGFNKSGPEILDEVTSQIHASQIVHFGLMRGNLSMSDLSTFGDSAEGLGRFVPGQDQSTALDIPATLAGDGAYARRPASIVDVPRITVVADMPERLRHTTGRATLFDVARYSVALCTAVALKAGAPLRVIHATDNNVDTVLNSSARNGYIALDAIDNTTSDRLENTAGGMLTEALGEVEISANRNEEIVFVVSDLLAGFSQDTGDFAWEEKLHDLHAQYGDRLLVAQLKSLSQSHLPIGIAKKMRLQDIGKIREKYLEIAQQKSERISRNLKHIRHAVIDNGSEYPTKLQLADFLLEKP